LCALLKKYQPTGSDRRPEKEQAGGEWENCRMSLGENRKTAKKAANYHKFIEEGEKSER